MMETHSLSLYFFSSFLRVSSMSMYRWGLTEIKTTSLEEMTEWLSVVKVIFLLVHQSLTLELVALAMMLVGSTVPDMIRPSAIACAMAPTN